MKNKYQIFVVLFFIFQTLWFQNIAFAQIYPASINIIYDRQFNPASLQVNQGEPLTVIISVTNNEGDNLRGVYLSEQIHVDFSVQTLSVKINGTDITNYVMLTGVENDVYPDHIPYYWILENPPDFPENNPLTSSSILEISYQLICNQNVSHAYNMDGIFGIVENNTTDSFFAHDDLTRLIQVGNPNSLKNIVDPINSGTFISGYPNPFNSEIKIKIFSSALQNISLNVYDSLGRQIKSLFNGSLDVGEYNFYWDGHNRNGKVVASGVYFCIMDRREKTPKIFKLINCR